jgi:hypothetical protein
LQTKPPKSKEQTPQPKTSLLAPAKPRKRGRPKVVKMDDTKAELGRKKDIFSMYAAFVGSKKAV